MSVMCLAKYSMQNEAIKQLLVGGGSVCPCEQFTERHNIEKNAVVSSEYTAW